MNSSIKGIICTLLLISCQSEKAGIRRFVDSTIEKTAFNGYLYVAKNGEVLFFNPITSPSPGLKAPGDTTKVYLASLTKLFTEIAILKLHQQGKIDLNAPISAYRSSFKPTFGNLITIDNLLKMSSGLPREISQETLPYVIFDDRNFAGPFLDSIPDFELTFTPGTNTKYSNLNYWILGAVIEQVTGKNLQDAFHELIFEELDMPNSGIFNTGSSIQKGYVFSNEKWQLDATNYQ